MGSPEWRISRERGTRTDRGVVLQQVGPKPGARRGERQWSHWERCPRQTRPRTKAAGAAISGHVRNQIQNTSQHFMSKLFQICSHKSTHACTLSAAQPRTHTCRNPLSSDSNSFANLFARHLLLGYNSHEAKEYQHTLSLCLRASACGVGLRRSTAKTYCHTPSSA